MKYIKLFEEFKINEMDNQNFPFIEVDTDFTAIIKKLDEEGVDLNAVKKTIKKIVTSIQAMTYDKNKAATATPADVKKEIVKLLTTFSDMLDEDGSISDDTYKNILLKEFGEKLVSLVKKQLDYIQKNK